MESLNNHDTVVVHRTDRPRTCVWTGDKTPSGAVAVRFETRLLTARGDVERSKYVWCSVDAIDALRQAIIASDQSRSTYAMNAPSDRGSVRFIDDLLGERSTCFACDTAIETGGFYEFHARSPRYHTQLVFCHASCREQVCEMLDAFWESLGKILGEAL